MDTLTRVTEGLIKHYGEEVAGEILDRCLRVMNKIEKMKHSKEVCITLRDLITGTEAEVYDEEFLASIEGGNCPACESKMQEMVDKGCGYGIFAVALKQYLHGAN